MNSVIAKLFVFINEVLSLFILLIPIAGLFISITQGNMWYAGMSLIALLLVITIFGFAAIMIENHKILKEMNEKMNK